MLLWTFVYKLLRGYIVSILLGMHCFSLPCPEYLTLSWLIHWHLSVLSRGLPLSLTSPPPSWAASPVGSHSPCLPRLQALPMTLSLLISSHLPLLSCEPLKGKNCVIGSVTPSMVLGMFVNEWVNGCMGGWMDDSRDCPTSLPWIWIYEMNRWWSRSWHGGAKK